MKIQIFRVNLPRQLTQKIGHDSYVIIQSSELAKKTKKGVLSETTLSTIECDLISGDR